MGKPRVTSERFASRFKAWLLSEEHPHEMKERMAKLDEHPRREEEAEARWHST